MSSHDPFNSASVDSERPMPFGFFIVTVVVPRLAWMAAIAISCLDSQIARAQETDVTRWRRQAQNVTIVRDDWGIPHIYGKTDADAVFGLLYAQAEDDFNRVERNYLNALGRTAEVEGEDAIYKDLRMRLFIRPDEMRVLYARSPGWLKALMNAFADGLNFYLHEHPDVKPKVIKRFEPWMALTFSEGSIGGDVERVSVEGLRQFYGDRPGPAPKKTVGGAQHGVSREPNRAPPLLPAITAAIDADQEPRGSNGIAIAPANTRNQRALLLINPHTTFFFRAEAHVVSQEGLNAYGAVTWGQFFVYQGFNERLGWMHTSSTVDNIDEYLEAVTTRDGQRFYRYGNEERPMLTEHIAVAYETGTGLATREFAVYRTHHGPIVRTEGEKWVSVRLMEAPVKALTQSYTRTKARNYQEFRQTMELHTNSSNNTIYADADGNIAYFHSNFIPWRDPSFDWSRPVDGSDPATEWGDAMGIEESPHLLNPPTGWLYNTNNWPYSAAGPSSPKRWDYPAYVDRGTENFRGLQAIRLLQGRGDFTLETLAAAAYDSYLTAFEAMLPPLFRDYDAAPGDDPLKARLAEQIATLRAWDLRWSVTSVPTSLAIFWGEHLHRTVAAGAAQARISASEYARVRATASERLNALAAASDRLEADFGSWRTPWGEINRFQRITGDPVPTFSDAEPSIPVPFPSGGWGSLASFGAVSQRGTKRRYGTSGNSFVAVVEFGDIVRARAVMAGGQSGHPESSHFNDQAVRYSTGDLRPVYFHRSELAGHVEREYHPGRP